MNTTTTHILAIRHGETEWNCLGRYQGQTDIALNEAGHLQAQQTAAALAAVPLDAIYTSDLSRALHTAQALARVKGTQAVSDKELREQHFGVFQGLDSGEIVQRWPEAFDRWHRREPGFGPEGGETRDAFHRRCVSAIERLARAHVGGTIAIVCHGGVLDCLYRAASGIALDAPRAWSLENAAVSRLRHDAGGFAIVDWSNTSHLERSARDEVPDRFPVP